MAAVKKTRRLRAIGFDLGETLVFHRDTPLNWSSLYSDALQSVADCCDFSPTSEQLDNAGRILAGFNTRTSPRANEVQAKDVLLPVLSLWAVNNPADLERSIDAFFAFFRRRLGVYDETLPALNSLRQRGYPLGILTDVPYGMPRKFVEQDLTEAGLSGLYDVLLTSADVGMRKPQPMGYFNLATQLGVAPQEMIYVGNEPKDVIGARRAGAVAVFLDRDGTGARHGQDFTISTLSGLNEIL